MKDFTVFRTWSILQELEQDRMNASVLIRISEDGTFRALNTKAKIQGRWDYASQDGQLILAPGRTTTLERNNARTGKNNPNEQDMLLSGSVICTDGIQQIYANDNDSANTETTTHDHNAKTHQISVPFGCVESGRFTYPPEHPAFFDTHPIYRPTTAGRFQFQKVISEIPEADRNIEKFQPSQLANKRFFLTAEPTRKKKKERWSNWRKQMVEVPDEHEANDNDKNNNLDNPDPFSASMQVMQVELFSNSTFVTIGGLGQAVTLRGKWMIIGQDKDQLWMQVWRFGFGRSVSGSTYSEGAQLTQNDDKGYWGTIYEQEGTGRFEVRGMVMLGYGLEPTTIGRFTMIEQQDDIAVVVDYEEYEEEKEEEGKSSDDDDDNWGAFE
eukprot:CAMPEP_0196802296 /NCGR_PEP_ID=MMETSP1362-20130617/1926_1 /TAXON_ID=163516 /ORGANISM="Leptocylindrus danicus, Strain CCMP1856" /LENGTH=382 /DNA_ID=CAMNT_0042173553 /DNA_START=301 /DNA_END=1449 /DNA_ORIENTATION=-